jgi:hypothetical protein
MEAFLNTCISFFSRSASISLFLPSIFGKYEYFYPPFTLS